jgi:hypothetical protein
MIELRLGTFECHPTRRHAPADAAPFVEDHDTTPRI